MSRRKLARKDLDHAERNLRLVPPPKPSRRRKRRWKLKIGAIRKRGYENRRELHVWEDAIVLAAVGGFDRPVTVLDLEARYPGRFNRRCLFFTLVRLARAERVGSGRRFGMGLWWKLPVNSHATFWSLELHNKHGG